MSQQSPGMFTCKNGVAVVMEHRCDYIDHCGDLSDEQGCGPLPKRSAETTTSTPSNCSHGEFACLSVTHCIPASQLCDFLKQCPDGSDESHCGACDFSKDMCGLQAARTQSQPRWTRLSALMVSNNRMRFPSLPREDSSRNERGFYAAFLKTDAAVPRGRNTALMTPQLGAMGHTCRLTFYTFLPKQNLPVYISVDVVETLRDTDKVRTLKKNVLRAWEGEEQVTWKMQAVNVGNRRPGTRFYFSAGENASIDDIEYHHCHPDETKEESVNCTFEKKSGCGWYPENIADSGDWEIISGNPSFAIPDHTTGNVGRSRASTRAYLVYEVAVTRRGSPLAVAGSLGACLSSAPRTCWTAQSCRSWS
ncbi:hypothetical protein HPB49_024437 [Dermacentor silvarum]|uniref:Uncharacterized protein n=1 Tax=Dermacentor silvarum TaxID=543639 RepID=A0ACB8DLM8_DERSI|nr:hypothetical protein HPB49_024437 [Dermacentor silvarum]